MTTPTRKKKRKPFATTKKPMLEQERNRANYAIEQLRLALIAGADMTDGQMVKANIAAGKKLKEHPHNFPYIPTKKETDIAPSAVGAQLGADVTCFIKTGKLNLRDERTPSV